MFEFWREATATSVPGLLCQSGRRRPENVSILSSLLKAGTTVFHFFFKLTLDEGKTVDNAEITKRKDVTKTGNGERGAGSGERGTEVWERVVSGNLHKIQYGR